MFDWIKRFFGATDRVTAAGERAAAAAEDIATMMEQARDQFRARLGIEAPVPIAVKPIAAPTEVAEPAAETGRKKRAAG